MKGLRIGRRRARGNGLPSSPLELALTPAISDERWHIPDRFNFTRDVVEALASDHKRRALTFLGKDGVIEPRTFKQISEGASRWAAQLRERGIQHEDRVVVLAGSGLEWLEVILGVVKVGAVAVPCSPALSAPALEARVSSAEAALVVAEHSCQAAIAQMSYEPDVHYLDEGRHRRSSDVPDDSPTHDTSSRDLAFILSTPGTGGTSKQVAHTHGSVFATRVAAEHWLDAGRGDAVWCTAPSDSPHAVWSSLVGPWSRGAEVVLHQGEFDPLERLDLLYRLGPTILCQSPAEYRALAELRQLERFRSPRLRRLVSTGDHLEPEIIATFEERWGMTIHDGYGQAETNVVVANGAEDGFKPGALGRAVPGHHVAIIDGEGNELPVGIEGDLAVRGRPPTLFAGYWESPEETKSAFRGDWYLTGDVATEDEDGFFWFVGRAEDVITSSGRTFGPFEVERVLTDHEAIAESAVIGLRDLQRGGQFVRAYVVARPGNEGSEQLEAELRQFVGQALPEQLVPREIVFVEEIPTLGGKVSRHLLRERPVGGRPLWELPPTSESEAEAPPLPPTPPPAAAPAPPPAPPVAEAVPVTAPVPELPATPVLVPPPEPVAEAAPVWEQEPVQAPEPMPVQAPEPMPEQEPVAAAEPEAVVVREPEPVAEAMPLAEPEPEPPVETEALAAPELEPEAEAPRPDPEPEPVAVAGEREPAPEPEPMSAPTTIAEVAPASEPTHRPEFTVVSAPEPEALPDFVVDSPESTPVAPPAPEPVASTPEPLPDFVIQPEEGSARSAPPPLPEPEPEPELGPLPDYVVDPSRPQESRPNREQLRPAAEAPKTFLEVASDTESGDSPSRLYFPPATSFPGPREDSDEGEVRRESSRPSRRLPAPQAGKTKRGKSGGAEPGDEADEVSWMAGLSNRLSAYSLAEEEASSSGVPAEEDPKDAETGS